MPSFVFLCCCQKSPYRRPCGYQCMVLDDIHQIHLLPLLTVKRQISPLHVFKLKKWTVTISSSSNQWRAMGLFRPSPMTGILPLFPESRCLLPIETSSQPPRIRGNWRSAEADADVLEIFLAMYLDFRLLLSQVMLLHEKEFRVLYCGVRMECLSFVRELTDAKRNRIFSYTGYKVLFLKCLNQAKSYK